MSRIIIRRPPETSRTSCADGQDVRHSSPAAEAAIAEVRCEARTRSVGAVTGSGFQPRKMWLCRRPGETGGVHRTPQ
ncbi:hypothetical protein AB0D62_18295 [Streptomyces massasporeus]|uniref:hypothetical protein n=1 Tax=Streptomyces massasporeus TaxID=67324 RepID=UPI0033D47A5E